MQEHKDLLLLLAAGQSTSTITSESLDKELTCT